MSDFLRIGRVAATNHGDRSYDLVMTDDGSRLAGVQVLGSHGSSNTGTAALTSPATPPSGNQWDLTQATDRDVFVVVAPIGRRFVALGHLQPQVSQMTFADGRKVERHATDNYDLIDMAGDREYYHPSGTYLRIGVNPAHEDLTGTDVDGRWKVAANTGTAPHFRIHVSAGGAAKADLNIDPSGNLTITSVAGNATLTFPAGMTIVTPNLAVVGSITATGEITAGAGGADSVGLQTHNHPTAPLGPPSSPTAGS